MYSFLINRTASGNKQNSTLEIKRVDDQIYYRIVPNFQGCSYNHLKLTSFSVENDLVFQFGDILVKFLLPSVFRLYKTDCDDDIQEHWIILTDNITWPDTLEDNLQVLVMYNV